MDSVALHELRLATTQMKNSNDAAKLRAIKTNKYKAMFAMQMLLRDAVQAGRLDPTMLANEEVMRIANILLTIIEILISKASSYFDTHGLNNQLDLINVEVIEDQVNPYFTLLHNRVPVATLFEITRNICNFKMEAVTEVMYRSGIDTNEGLSLQTVFLPWYELTVRTSHFAKQSFYFRKKCETNYAKKKENCEAGSPIYFFSDSCIKTHK